MLELIQSGKKIPENNVDVFDFINTLDLYAMINEGINKHYQRDAAQRVTNDMVKITNFSTTAHSNTEATYAGQEEINHLKVRVDDLNEEVRHLWHELRGNMNNDDYVSHDETIPVNNVLEPNNTIDAHIVERKKDSFYDWVDTYDEWNGYYHTPTEEDESGSSHTFTGDNNIFKIFWVNTTSLQSQKSSTTGPRRQDLLVKHLHL